MTERGPENPGKKKKRILIFCDYYLPSQNSGGGMWTVVNLVDRFCDRYDFSIVTRNHDNRNDTTPFTSVRTNEWNEIGHATVMYLAPSELTRRRLLALVDEIKPDGVFLNSFFSTPCVKFLFARRRASLHDIPVVLAPCGELSPGAIDLKKWKKLPFLLLAKSIKLHRKVIWKASSPAESQDIKNVMGAGFEVLIAPDLPPAEILPDFLREEKPIKKSGSVKLVFFSRISRKKNLGFLFDRLIGIAEGSVELTIVGPEEDAVYVAECRRKEALLPPNIKTRFVGAVPYAEGLKLLILNHFLILPTLNENFGYVLLEALASGCPLLISDKTMWGGITDIGAGWVIPLDRPRDWEYVLEKCISMDTDEYTRMSVAARRYALEWLTHPDHEEATADVLRMAFGD